MVLKIQNVRQSVVVFEINIFLVTCINIFVVTCANMFLVTCINIFVVTFISISVVTFAFPNNRRAILHDCSTTVIVSER
jgi:hypothetical protein